MNDNVQIWFDEHIVDSVFKADINTAKEILDLVDSKKTLELIYNDAGSWTYNICVCSVRGVDKELRVVFTGRMRVVLYAWMLTNGAIVRGWFIA